ncbi:hypothetical protein DXG01_008222 [Tephrocybe rancida]|nr:hypothetical protein DXG01_008222 [Tephrocybe rancida]
MATRQRRASLAAYLDSPNIPVPLPSLPSEDLTNALNAQKYAPGNNDVLEFIGDRVVNLACALMASKINHSPAQQTLVARRLSKNDTLGRIAHQLRLPQHARARLDPGDRRAAEAWSRRQSGSPPKLFADLFESYTGALFLRHGWHYTHAWLRKVYAPIIAAAARDALTTTEVAPSRWSAPDAQPWTKRTQWSFEDFMEERSLELKEATKAVMQALPKSEVSTRREEVGMQLLKLWICELALSVYPELRGARERGAHFLSSITSALMSDDTLGHLALLLSLFRPVILPSPTASVKPTPPADTRASKRDSPLDTLLSTFEHFTIDPKLRADSTESSSQEIKSSKSRDIGKAKTKKYTIKIDALWLVGSSNADVKDDVDLDLDPYKLLDEGGAFPAPETGEIVHQNNHADTNAEQPVENLPLAQKNESSEPKDAPNKATGAIDPTKDASEPATEGALDSDGSQDMEFSSSSSGTESDMMFSSDESDEPPCAGTHHDESRPDAGGLEDVLSEALERLEIAPSSAVREEDTALATPSPGASKGQVQELTEKEKAPVGSGLDTELEDMEFPSSSEQPAEDANTESDMEFSSDEENLEGASHKPTAAPRGEANGPVSSPTTSLPLPTSRGSSPTRLPTEKRNPNESSSSKGSLTSSTVEDHSDSHVASSTSPLLGKLDANVPLDSEVRFKPRKHQQGRPGPARRQMFGL